jgi:hypothetical protein
VFSNDLKALLAATKEDGSKIFD